MAAPRVKVEEDDDAARPLGGLTPGSSGGAASNAASPGGVSYTDYVLRSCAPTEASGWNFNVMKLSHPTDRAVDLGGTSEDGEAGAQWVQPIRLNRKDPGAVRKATEEEREKLRRQGLDGGVKAEDVEDVEMATAEEQADMSLIGGGKRAPAAGRGGMFKKKFKRVFVSSEEARRLKREEYQPWVLEDDGGNERWIGRLEGGAGAVKEGAKSSTTTGTNGWRPAAVPGETGSGGGGSSYVLFVVGEGGEDFKVMPVNRWYKFTQDPKYVTLRDEEAEQQYTKLQKHTSNDASERWMMHRRAGGSTGPASAGPSRTNSNSSLASTHSRLLTKSSSVQVKREGSIALPGQRMRSVIKHEDNENKRGGGQEQEDDEFDFDEEFADDEEGIAKIDDNADEEETKELEERIKKEMRIADKAGLFDDSDEEKPKVKKQTKEEREVKKLMKRHARKGEEDSDDDDGDDSDVNPYASSEEESEDEPVPTLREGTAGQGGNLLGGPTYSPAVTRPPSVTPRGGSPGAGSSTAARRALSPGRGGSATKRKRTESGEDGGKRRKPGSPSPPGTPTGSDDGNSLLITEPDLIAFLRSRAGDATTQDVLKHFKRQLRKDERNKTGILLLLKKVSKLEGGKLVLKEARESRDRSMTPALG